MKTKKYIIENLDCPHCGAKIERLISEMDGVKEVSLSFPLMQLRLTAENPDEMLPDIIKTAKTVEDEFNLKVEKTKAEHEEDSKTELITLIAGTVLYAAAIIFGLIVKSGGFGIIRIIMLVAAYLCLGGEVLLTAAKNITKGKIFDENFLMSLATLGAFAIQEYTEAVGVMLFFRIGELFEKVAVNRSRSRIMQAVDLRPETVNLVTGDDVKVISAEDARAGDIILVRPGDRIPLDGVVIDGKSRIDTSAITGEPVPVKAEPGNKIMSGCVNTTGALRIRAESTLQNSMVSRILESVENAAAGKPKIDNFITRFARIYTPIVVAAALFTAVVIPLATGQEFYPWIYTALSFLVMSCPCALVLSVPLAYFCGIGTASKYGILFKGGIALEQLANIKAIVMDKTGTVTKGTFTVKSVSCANGYTENEILALCAASEMASTHPIAESIVDEAKIRGLILNKADSIEEISGKGIKANVNGAEILAGNIRLMNDYGVDISDYNAQSGGTEVLVAIGGRYAGVVLIADTIKNGAVRAIGDIKRRGIKTAMLTGDLQGAAESVALETGIDETYARLLPGDKLERLKEIRERCGSVMFVGDGINDAPVLAGADVGAAMGSGADAAIEAADVVFMNSDIASIPKAVSIAKRTAAIAIENVVFALTVKIIVMILGITGIYSNMWLAVFADTGVAFLCILNSIRILYKK